MQREIFPSSTVNTAGAFATLAVLIALLFLSAIMAAAQERGFHPGGSYAFSEIEAINVANGNMIVTIPLASLPPGRGGVPGPELKLVYNSKLLETHSEQIPDPGTGQLVSQIWLNPAVEGGWRYSSNFRYTLKLISRLNLEGQYPCVCDGNYQKNAYIWKLMMIFPDGGEHEFRPLGYTDFYQDGYYNIDPQGRQFGASCTGGSCTLGQFQGTTSGMTYYSTDGTFMRLFVPYSSNGNGGWTLSFPDGRRLIETADGQTMYDRNNNLIPIGMSDALGRQITMQLEAAPNEDHIFVTGANQQLLKWIVKWKTVYVARAYYATAAGAPQQRGNRYLQVLRNDARVVDRITLPAQAGGLTYVFGYSASDTDPYPGYSPGWGELNSITLPGGARADYQWAFDGSGDLVGGQPPQWDWVLNNHPAQKELTYLREDDGTATPTTESWTYFGSFKNSGSFSVIAPDGGVTKTYSYAPATNSPFVGYAYKTENPDGSVTERVWKQNRPQGLPAIPKAVNPYVAREFHSLRNAAQVLTQTAIKEYNYDKNGNLTEVNEYDWVDYGSLPRDAEGHLLVPAQAVLKKRTTSTYYNPTPEAADATTLSGNVYTASSAPPLLTAVKATEISAGGAALARSEFFYDNPLTTGNLTQQKTWDSTKGAYSNPLTSANSISVATQYNSFGSPTLLTDASGVQTRLTYGPIAGLAELYPTQIETASGTALQRTETRQYDFHTGLITAVTDVDNNVSTLTSYDDLGRPVLVRAAAGLPSETQTATQYFDAARRVVVRSDLEAAGDLKLASIQHFDQLGRVRLTRQLEVFSAAGLADETMGLKVQTRYLHAPCQPPSGQCVPASYVLSSNPYRAATSGAAGGEATMGWTRSKADQSGRIIEVQTFGGAGLPAPWGSNNTSTGTVTTAFDANFTTVSDQAQKQRRSMTDGLGRLVRVDEPDLNGNLGSTTSPNQPTHYGYDVVGNLTQVSQSNGATTQLRTFVYSSLSRLTQATNPESGTITYQYDDSGNLVVKTDARAVSAHYSYDALNRLTRRWYNSSSHVSAATHNQPGLPASVGATDEVKFYYDLQTLPAGAPNYVRGASIGRLVAETYGTGSNGDYFAYDNLGRPTLKYQQIGAVNYRMSAVYNRAGAITSLTYPSAHAIANTFDQAGRLSVFSGNIGDGTSRTYAAGVLYSATGAMVKEQFGTNTAIYNKLFYNSRGQLAEIRASSGYTGPTDTTSDRGAIINHYSAQCAGVCAGSSMPDNNGNLRKQEIHIPNQTMRWQEYAYDSLNRLSWAREVLNGGAEQWKQAFTYDRWGNRTINNAVTYGTGINNKAFKVNATNNRLEVPAGQSGVLQYDVAGNLTNDTYTGAGNRTYDGENKITSAGGGNNQAQLYAYSGSGHRIKRTVDGVQTWQVYGFGGELLAEYAANGAAASPQKEYGYRNGQLLVTGAPSTSAPVNVALASNGATVTASSSYAGFAASGAINGDRKGLFGWQNGYWSTAGAGFPAWLEVQFNGSKTITEIDVVTAQDNYNAPIEPTESTTFTQYGLIAYQVQYWNGSAWANIPQGSVTGNNKVWKKFTFAALTTTKIRVLASASPDNYSRLTEIEAWTGPSPAPRYNLALNATATASSSYAGWGPSSLTNGDRKSLNAGNNGGWVDAAPANTFPDWAQVDFGASKTINEINVFTLQDNYAGSVEPTESMTFTQWGLTGYEVQYWDGGHWVTVPGGAVSGNNKIWRKFTFSPISTNKIRVLTNASVDGFSRLTEIEAYGPADTGGSSSIHWLLSDHLGTPRMIFDHTGDLAKLSRHDYLPFGEELVAPTGGRTAAMGYAGDGVRQQFTHKERDTETGLDYFLARYYSSTQGRFTSPDEFSGGPDELYDFTEAASANPTFYADLTNPQSLNKYQYSYNNPLRYIDPDGHEADESQQQQQQGPPPPPAPPNPYGFQPYDPQRQKEKLDGYEAQFKCQKGDCSDVNNMIPPVPILPLVTPAVVQPAPQTPPSPDARRHRKKGTTNPANLPKHQRGTRRKQKDQGGEKADPKRTGMPFHRKRPNKWKGPWPPKPPKPPEPPEPKKTPEPS